MRKLSLTIAFMLLITSIYAADPENMGDELSDIAGLAVRFYRDHGRTPTVKEYNDAVAQNNLAARYYGEPNYILPYHFPYRPLPVPPSGYTESAKGLIWQSYQSRMLFMANVLVGFAQKKGDLVYNVVDEHTEEILGKIIAISVEEAKEYTDALNKALNIQIDTKAYIDSRIKENAEKEKSGHNF